MAIAARIGAVLEAPSGVPAHAFWFGEDQARYVVTTRPHIGDEVLRAGQSARVPIRRLGATGGPALALAGERPLRVDDLRERFESWLPAYMAATA
jgi:phosphoribosylformylglycinamidine synthase